MSYPIQPRVLLAALFGWTLFVAYVGLACCHERATLSLPVPRNDQHGAVLLELLRLPILKDEADEAYEREKARRKAEAEEFYATKLADR